VQLPTPTGVTRIDVESARDMYAAVHRQVADADVFIAAAAVADFQPVTVAKQKSKKQGVSVKLDLEPAPDIIKSVADMAKRPYVVGFAAETKRRRRERAHQTQAQEARHDCRQPSRRGDCVRLRRQCAHRHLARRQDRGRARTENRSRAPAHRLDRSTPAAARRHSEARSAQTPRRRLPRDRVRSVARGASQVQRTIKLRILDPRIGREFPLPQHATAAPPHGLARRIDAPLALGPGAAELIPTGISIYIADPGLAAVLLPRSVWAIRTASCSAIWSV